jgi:hypothetical protein
MTRDHLNNANTVPTRPIDDPQTIFVNYTPNSQRPSHELSKRMRTHVMKRHRQAQRDDRRRNGPRKVSTGPNYKTVISQLASCSPGESLNATSPTIKESPSPLTSSESVLPLLAVHHEEGDKSQSLMYSAQASQNESSGFAESIHTWLDGSLEPFQVLELLQQSRSPQKRHS